MVRTSRSVRRLVVVLTSAALAVTGVSVAGLAATTTAATASDSGMLSQVNAARTSRGLDPYSWNAHLASVAGEQARRMAKKTKLYHNPNLASDVGSYRWVGENVGYGPSSSAIQKAFMNSPGHKANILDDNYTQIGIASVRDSKGRLWVAQVFRQPVGGGSSGDSKSSGKKSSKKSKAKAKAKTSAPAKKRTTTVTRRDNASAPKARTPKAKPVAHEEPAEPTLQQRVSFATAGDNAAPSTDPLADALAFAATMNAVGG